MPFGVKSYPEESPYIERWQTVTTAPLVILKGQADPKTLTSQARWKVWQEIYDINGNLATKLFMNGSNLYDQIWDNRSTVNGVTTVYS